MAKKKTSASTSHSSNGSPAKRPPRANSAPRRSLGEGETKVVKTKAEKTVTAAPQLSHHDIGEAAGEVWKALAEENGQTLAALKKKVTASSDLAVAALGWLAREDKVEFVPNGRTVNVWLR